MSKDLPTTTRPGSLPAMPSTGLVPPQIRAAALKKMDRVLEVWTEILNDPRQKGATRNSAGKLIAEVAAVRSSVSIPRDEVFRHLQLFAAYLAERYGEDEVEMIKRDILDRGIFVL